MLHTRGEAAAAAARVVFAQPSKVSMGSSAEVDGTACLPSRLLWLLWTVPQRGGLDFLGNFCFLFTVNNILPPCTRSLVLSVFARLSHSAHAPVPFASLFDL